MIFLHHHDGASFLLNADLIERVESSPETVVVLVDGTRHPVSESLGEVVDKIRSARAAVLALAEHLTAEGSPRRPQLRLVGDPPGGAGLDGGEPGGPGAPTTPSPSGGTLRP